MRIHRRCEILPLSPGPGNSNAAGPPAAAAPRPSSRIWFGPQLGSFQRLRAQGGGRHARAEPFRLLTPRQPSWTGAGASRIGQKPFWKGATPNSFEGAAVNSREVAMGELHGIETVLPRGCSGQAFLKISPSVGVVLGSAGC